MRTVLASELTEEMERLFAELSKGPGQAAMVECGAALSDQIELQFAASQTPQGEPWSAWRFRRPAASDSHKTLWDTGRLRNSLVGETSDSIRQYTDNEMVYGTSVEYAGTHNQGATVSTNVWLVSRGGTLWLPPGSTLQIPQRRMTGWSEETLNKCEAIIANGVMARVF